MSTNRYIVLTYRLKIIILQFIYFTKQYERLYEERNTILYLMINKEIYAINVWKYFIVLKFTFIYYINKIIHTCLLEICLQRCIIYNRLY